VELARTNLIATEPLPERGSGPHVRFIAVIARVRYSPEFACAALNVPATLPDENTLGPVRGEVAE